MIIQLCDDYLYGFIEMIREAAKEVLIFMALTPLELYGRRNFKKKLKQDLFSLMAGPLPPPGPPSS